jgi:glycosyltransferase involved in cell wall biosynthesis
MDNVFIILALYKPNINYLKQQLDSIYKQTHQNFQCLCLLDGKDEDLLNTLKSFNLDERFLIESLDVQHGSSRAFEIGLEKVSNSANYIAFCDQDDLWHQNKLSVCIETIETTRAKMVYHEARIIDAKGEVLSESLGRYERRQERATPLQQLLYNHCSGMSLVFRRDLILRALPIPKQSCGQTILYDWWLSLFANSNQLLTFIDEPLIDYRSHQSNQYGPQAKMPLTPRKILKALLKPLLKPSYAKTFYLTRHALCSNLLRCGVSNQTAWRAFRQLRSATNFMGLIFKSLLRRDLLSSYALYVMQVGKIYLILSRENQPYRQPKRSKS